MWKNMLEPFCPQMKIQRMRFVCCITKTTDTNSEYVTLIAFPWRLRGNFTLYVRCLFSVECCVTWFKPKTYWDTYLRRVFTQSVFLNLHGKMKYIDILVSFPYVKCKCEAYICTRICRNCAAGLFNGRVGGGACRDWQWILNIFQYHKSDTTCLYISDSLA
jgi:hypothetical protein